MATRRIIAALACAGAVACATTEIGKPDRAAPAPFEDPAARPGLATLLIAMPESRDFITARKGLVAEIKNNINVTTFIVTPASTMEDLAAAIERSSPVCVVLMNNTALALFQKYRNRSVDSARAIPPAVVLMTSFLEETAARIKDITGIAYEVPGVTAFVQLRMVLSVPVNRVGVIYRPAFSRFVERQKALAARENVELVPMAVPADVTPDELRTALGKLARPGAIDALWILNDNGLIHDSAFIAETWRRVLRDANIPLVVGVPNLVDPSEAFGTLAVVPDHEALGLQAANLILDMAENGWNISEHPIELPLSVKTVVDVKQVRERFGLRRGALQRIDQALDQ